MGEDTLTFYAFTLTSDLVSNIADADLVMAGTGQLIDDVEVKDNVPMFAGLEPGANGLCIVQGQDYTIIQAECP